MAEDLLRKMRGEAEEIFKASVHRVDPYEATGKFVRMKEGKLSLGSEKSSEIELELDAIVLSGPGIDPSAHVGGAIQGAPAWPGAGETLVDADGDGDRRIGQR